MSEHALRWRVRRGGPWQIVLPGVYAAFTGTLTELQRWQAALLYGGEGAALTGVPGLRMTGLCTSVQVGPTPILIPHDRRRRSVPGVVVLRSMRMPATVLRNGIAAATPVRALADACRLSSNLAEVRALVTGGLRSPSIPLGRLRVELETGPRKGSALLRRVLDEYGEGVRSVAEAEARTKILGLPIPAPVFNPDLHLPDGAFLARPDAYWEEAALAFEVDSREHHGDMDGWERTQRRHALMTAHELTVIHASPHRIRTDWRVLGAELVAAYRIGTARPAPAVRATA